MKLSDLFEATKFSPYLRWLIAFDWWKYDAEGGADSHPAQYASHFAKKHGLKANEIYDYIEAHDESPPKLTKSDYEAHKEEILRALLFYFKTTSVEDISPKYVGHLKAEIKDAHAAGIDWPELKVIEKSIDSLFSEAGGQVT